MKKSSEFKIFIIDDSVFIINSLMDLLPNLGFEVAGMSSTGKSAFKYVAETRPDLVLLDTSISDFTSEEIIRGLLAINKNLEIIVMAPLSQQNEVANLFRVGARDYLPKPLVPQQVEYVLRNFELSNGIKPTTEIQTIAQLYSIFLEELIKHTPSMYEKEIHRAIFSPIKRLNKQYTDRYLITVDPIKILLKLAQDTHTKKIYKMYKRQLDNLYLSVANKISKFLPNEYVESLFIEAYHSYFPLAQHLLEKTDFRFPVWGDFDIDNSRAEVQKSKKNARFDYIYLKLEDCLISFKENSVNINERLEPYRTMVRHDPRLARRFPKPDVGNYEDVDLHVILSQFDEIFGPKAEFIHPPPHGRIEKDKLQSIPRLLDLIGANPGEPFIHSMNDYGSINLVFSVKNTKARGGSKDFMISVVISPADIRPMVKISQLSSILRAISMEISNHYAHTNGNGQDEKVLSEPVNILTQLLDEIKIYLNSNIN